MKYIYGMRNRPLGPGCQPDGFIDWQEDPSGQYHNILFYPRRLTLEEAYQYELDYLGEVKTKEPTQAQDEAAVVNVSVEDTLTDDEKNRLFEVFDSKFTLERHAFGDAYHVEPRVESDRVYLMNVPTSLEEPAKDYLMALISFTKQATRVNHRAPAKGTSEKYAFRTWLNRIGLKGPRYKATRKALLSNLKGSASYAEGITDEKNTKI